MLRLIKKNIYLCLLLLILGVGLFFRTLELTSRLEFAHDADLFSWIVKDIVVDHHLRLIGQLTTAKGIFIGPLFYYSLIPFFLLTNMDPIGAVIPVLIVGILTIISFYYVFSKLFTKETGLIAAFLQAALLKQIYFDRWVVPTITTFLWSVWYLFVLLQISRGNFKYLPILGILLGLIWHIHIALIPILLALPIAFLISKKLPSLKDTGLFFASLIVTSLPLIVFETRHNFSQTKSLLINFTADHGSKAGLEKLQLVIIYVGKGLVNLFFYPVADIYRGTDWLINIANSRSVVILFFISGFLLVKFKLINIKELLVLYAWVLGSMIFFSLSSSPISEYYFANLDTVYLLFAALFLYKLFSLRHKLFKIITFGIFAVILIHGFSFFINQDIYHKGYVEKKAAVKFIIEDSKKKSYPCVSVSYITDVGEGVGFRYLFYLNNLHVNQSKSGSPVYSIVIPAEKAWGTNEVTFKHIKVIPPDKNYSKEEIEKSCSGQNSNLTDPLFGFTN